MVPPEDTSSLISMHKIFEDLFEDPSISSTGNTDHTGGERINIW